MASRGTRDKRWMGKSRAYISFQLRKLPGRDANKHVTPYRALSRLVIKHGRTNINEEVSRTLFNNNSLWRWNRFSSWVCAWKSKSLNHISLPLINQLEKIDLLIVAFTRIQSDSVSMNAPKMSEKSHIFAISSPIRERTMLAYHKGYQKWAVNTFNVGTLAWHEFIIESERQFQAERTHVRFLSLISFNDRAFHSELW